MYVSRAAAVNSAQYQTVLLLYNPTVFMLTLSRLLKTKSGKYRQVSLQVNTRGHVTLPQSDQHLANSTLFRKLYVSMIKRGNCTFIKVRSNTVSQDSNERASGLVDLATSALSTALYLVLSVWRHKVTKLQAFPGPFLYSPLAFTQEMYLKISGCQTYVLVESVTPTATKDIH